MRTCVERHLPVHVFGPTGGRRVMVVGYHPGDPYAVRLTFPDGTPDGGVTWLIARDLLAAGLAGPAGDGAVRIRPWPNGRIRLAFRGADATRATVLASTAPLAEFLTATQILVPPGTEPTHQPAPTDPSALFPTTPGLTPDHP
ncbi:SsgA family sporulation/cell division regulator [Kitasatospora sp. NPDC059795]|uniref:SsgA family sporulation/cell division regulator n=1 Tax=Kitasatospora sp. NPDC059795 TaxID=3346949 RepID=UPI00365D39B2